MHEAAHVPSLPFSLKANIRCAADRFSGSSTTSGAFPTQLRVSGFVPVEYFGLTASGKAQELHLVPF